MKGLLKAESRMLSVDTNFWQARQWYCTAVNNFSQKPSVLGGRWKVGK